jgi:hypothetical protein
LKVKTIAEGMDSNKFRKTILKEWRSPGIPLMIEGSPRLMVLTK